MKSKYIYTITDPRNSNIFYVGVSVDVKKRAMAHMNLRLSAPCRNTIEEIVNSNMRPLFTIVNDKCDNWRETEQQYIKKYIEMGHNLLNKQSLHIKKDYGFDLKKDGLTFNDK